MLRDALEISIEHMDKTLFIKQLGDILADFEEIKDKCPYDDLSGDEFVEDLSMVTFRSKAAIARIAGSQSVYYKDVQSIIDQRFYPGRQAQLVIGCVKALMKDLENDYLKSIADIIQADVFGDYLEMADHLLLEGYKDAAAVLIGSTLEVQLRELCIENSIDLELRSVKGKIAYRGAEAMNVELAKARVYSPAYQKQTTAWLSLRNSAAHGKYGDYSVEQIKLMLEGVRQFVRHSKRTA